jgi:hypothetical protein
VGGLDAGGRGLRQVLRYDGAAAWGTDLLTLLPSPRRDGAMVVLPAGRSAWLVGGRETDLAGDRPVTDLWRISLDDLSFHPVALPGPAPLFVGGAAAGDPVTGDVYLYGGWSDVDDLRSVSAGFVRFRTSTLVAEDLPGGPEARALAGLAWTGDGLLLYGGLGAQGALGDVWRWTAADGWTRIDAPSRPALRPEVAWDAASRRLIAAGGTQPDQEIAAFDPEARTWTSLVALPGYADFGGEVAFLDPDGGSLAFLSAGAGGALADLDADPPTVTFREAPPPPAGSFHAFDPIGRRGLIFGGLRQDLPQPEVTSAFWTLPQRCPE